MNRVNNWEQLLEYANEELAKHGYTIDVNDDDERGFYECDILKDGEVVEVYAENYYEDELSGLVNDAWHYVSTELVK